VADGIRKSLGDPTFILPIRIDDTPFDQLPILIHQLNTLDFSSSRDAGFEALIAALQGAEVPSAGNPPASAPLGRKDSRGTTDASAPPKANAIAVLPFENLSADASRPTSLTVWWTS
jgi:hypothetical protein